MHKFTQIESKKGHHILQMSFSFKSQRNIKLQLRAFEFVQYSIVIDVHSCVIQYSV